MSFLDMFDIYAIGGDGDVYQDEDYLLDAELAYQYDRLQSVKERQRSWAIAHDTPEAKKARQRAWAIAHDDPEQLKERQRLWVAAQKNKYW